LGGRCPPWAKARTEGLNAHKEKQRPKARCQWLNRVIVVEAEIFNLHMHLLLKTSGQLRNLG